MVIAEGESVMRFLIKSFFLAFLLAGFGWGMYFVGQEDLLSLAKLKSEGMKVAKKIHAVKPPFLKEALKAVEPGPSGKSGLRPAASGQLHAVQIRRLAIQR